MTTTFVEEDIVVQEWAFEWGPVFAGAVVATGATLFLIIVGAAVGLSLAGTRNLSGGHTFLTIGAIYFLAAQGFGFALGGYITGRMMGPGLESEDEHFRTDAHGLAMWALTSVFGLSLAAIIVAAGLTQAAPAATQPMAYWADRLLTGAPVNDYAIKSGEAARLLTADALRPADDINNDRNQLVALTAAQNGISPGEAAARVDSVEAGIRMDADAARKATLYLAMWTALALLFGGFAAITATVLARFHDTDFSIRRFRRN